MVIHHMNKDNTILIAMIHVDDVIITGNNPNTIRAFKKALRDEYRMTDMGLIKHCLRLGNNT